MQKPDKIHLDKRYILDDPSEESKQIRKETDNPFVATILRSEVMRMQREGQLNNFFNRLESAGIISEKRYAAAEYNPQDHGAQGWYMSFWRDEQPKVSMLIMHKDEKVLHNLMQEFVNKQWLQEYSWKRLKNAIVS